jgi:hypothetical protein
MHNSVSAPAQHCHGPCAAAGGNLSSKVTACAQEHQKPAQQPRGTSETCGHLRSKFKTAAELRVDKCASPSGHLHSIIRAHIQRQGTCAEASGKLRSRCWALALLPRDTWASASGHQCRNFGARVELSGHLRSIITASAMQRQGSSIWVTAHSFGAPAQYYLST